MSKELCLILVCLLCSSRVWATSTGLNNIPTADVVSWNELVLQYFNNLENNRPTDHFLGFKYGPFKNVEVGLDGRVFPGKSQHEYWVAQAKVRFDLSDTWAGAAGVANLGDRAKAGREFPFVVLGGEVSGGLRAHIGGTVQKDNEGFFGGIDKKLTLWRRDLILRADIMQVNNGHDTLSSAGFLYDLGNRFILESWISFSSTPGREEIGTIKLNYVWLLR